MQLLQIEQQEAELKVKRRVKFKGTTCIRLKYLDFLWHKANENVERLKLCIKYKECYQLNSRYHIPAVIDQELLNGVIEAFNTFHVALLSNVQGQWLTLRFSSEVWLKCLLSLNQLWADWESLPLKD